MNDSFPLTINRWFKDGVGWASHPDMASHANEILTMAFQWIEKNTSNSRDMPVEIKFPYKDGYVMGIRFLDRHCQDVKAENRAPTVTILSVVPKSLSEKQKKTLFKNLWHYPLPEEPGPSENYLCSTGKNAYSGPSHRDISSAQNNPEGNSTADKASIVSRSVAGAAAGIAGTVAIGSILSSVFSKEEEKSEKELEKPKRSFLFKAMTTVSLCVVTAIGVGHAVSGGKWQSTPGKENLGKWTSYLTNFTGITNPGPTPG